MEISIQTKNKDMFSFRALEKSDAEMLGNFFESLSNQTRSKFGPHLLTLEYAKSTLCENIAIDNVSRFVIVSPKVIVGYFILDFNDYPHERDRYLSYGIDLDFSVDPVFAPCIHDKYQSQGVASLAMKALLHVLDKSKIKSLVLMGGTQEPNVLARNFYKKFNFQELGEFYTDHNDLNNVDMRLVF
ncbi:MAG: GNAT superfamily N-acetyltransferase [Oleiphilaceae bacterium]|jgi:GNAT superfamily N-acetyltransferase